MQKYQHVRILNMQNIATCEINNMHVALTTCIFNLPPIKQAFLATVHVDMQKSVEKCMSTWRPFFLMNPGPACQCCFCTVLYTIRKLQPAILLVLLSVANTWISGGLLAMRTEHQYRLIRLILLNWHVMLRILKVMKFSIC